MSISRISGTISVFLFLSFSPSIVCGGIGDETNPNPVGGFGQNTDLSSSNPNPTGGFSTEESGNPVVPLGVPPPPPDPVPLDGGVSLLILSAIGLGARKLYKELKS